MNNLVQKLEGLKISKHDDRWEFHIHDLDGNIVKRILEEVIEIQQTSIPAIVVFLNVKASIKNKFIDDHQARKEYISNGQNLCNMLQKAGKFSVAVVQSDTYDELFGLALACHHRIMLPNISIGFTSNKNGDLPFWGQLTRLTKLIGKHKTLNLLFLNSQINTSDPAANLFYDELVEDDQIKNSIDNLISKINKLDPVMLSMLIRNLGIGEEDENTLDRFEAYHDKLQHSPYKPEIEFSNTPSSYLRGADSTRNYTVILNQDLERKMMKSLKEDQVDFLFDQLMNEVDFEISGRVIDLGAGSCWLSAKLSRLPKVEEVVASELSDNELLTKGLVGLEAFDADLNKIRFKVGNFNAVDEENESFDYVFFARALHHSNDAEESLAQAYKVLKPGGRVIAFDEHIIPENVSLSRQEDLDQRTTEEYTKGDYKKIFEKCGFSVDFVPFYKNNYRKFLGFTYNDLHMIKYTPRRFFYGRRYARFHMVGLKPNSN